MNIENDIFRKYSIDNDKLIKYGFINNKYTYKIDDDFIIEVIYDKTITGKIIDTNFCEEYTNFRVETTGEFNNKLRNIFIDLMIDIRDKCCKEKLFIFDQSIRVNNYIKKKYKVNPEFLWEDTPGCGVYRKNNNKWFGIIMNVSYNKVNKDSNDSSIIEVINLKVDKNNISEYLKIEGVYPAYHMNKKSWVSIILNEYLDDEIIYSFIDNSYNNVK